MKKLIVGLIMLTIVSTNIFSLEKAIVNNNRVNVRSSTDLVSSNILYQLNAGDEILIYSSFGDETFVDGVYNLWYRISAERPEFINAFYINRFPFENRYKVDYPEGSMEYYQFITDYKRDNGTIYFYGNFYRNEGSPIGIGIWLEADEINWIGNKSNNIAVFSNKLLSKLHEQFLLIPSSIETQNYGNRIVKTYYFLSDLLDATIEIGGLVENHLQSLTVKSENVLLPFGIKIGMDREEVISIFGSPDRTQNNEFSYSIGYGFIINIRFKTNANKITQIIFQSSL